MTDRNINPEIDLSMESLRKVCKGDVSRLPKFVVHNNDAWPSNTKVAVDKKNRVHMRRAVFLRTVKRNLPVKPGLWIRPDAQEFTLDLSAHDLLGSEETKNTEGLNQAAARQVAKADEVGRLPHEERYGEEALSKSERRNVSRDDLAEVAKRRQKLSLRRSWLMEGDTERDLAMEPDD